jgi:hypothetical protein
MYFHSETQALTDALQVLSNSPYHQSWGLSKVGTYIVSLAAMDFASNDGTLWAIDFAAPYGHCREVVRALRECFPRGTKFRIYRTEQNRFGWVVA